AAGRQADALFGLPLDTETRHRNSTQKPPPEPGSGGVHQAMFGSAPDVSQAGSDRPAGQSPGHSFPVSTGPFSVRGHPRGLVELASLSSSTVKNRPTSTAGGRH